MFALSDSDNCFSPDRFSTKLQTIRCYFPHFYSLGLFSLYPSTGSTPSTNFGSSTILLAPIQVTSTLSRDNLWKPWFFRQSVSIYSIWPAAWCGHRSHFSSSHTRGESEATEYVNGRIPLLVIWKVETRASSWGNRRSQLLPRDTRLFGRTRAAEIGLNGTSPATPEPVICCLITGS